MTDYTFDIRLPSLHDDQTKAYQMPARFKVVRCGRRWGKTLLAEAVAVDAIVHSEIIGWFAPEYKFLAEPYRDVLDMLGTYRESSSEGKGVIRCKSGGNIDFWSMENPLAGRSRRYHGVIIDEAAFTKPGSIETWRRNIRPTLVDYQGWALVLSNTAGVADDNLLWQLCNQPEHGFKDYHAPSSNNPYLPAEELEELQKSSHPLVFRQEYLAEFVDWSGVAFFALSAMLVNDRPVEYPKSCDCVFAVIDTAIKTGTEHDGTAVIYCALDKYSAQPWKMIVLDWDYVQVEGASLEVWLPSVFDRLEELSRETRARGGSVGAWIEDKASGIILLQQARNKGMAAHAIDSVLTSVGKSERAQSVSGYVYRGLVKFSGPAYDKTTIFKGVSRNHMINQVTGFRIGSKEQVNDDCLDAFVYSVAISLGDAGGF